jgi:hypothetical protein
MIDGVKAYEQKSIRDKVVFRVDLFSALTDCFEPSTFQKYRAPLFFLVSGLISDQKIISGSLTEFYSSDKVFHNYFGELFYFHQKETFSMYDVLVKDILERVIKLDVELQQEMKGLGCRYLFTTEGYSYYVMSDTRSSLSLPKGYRGELVSNAKVWHGFIEKPD